VDSVWQRVDRELERLDLLIEREVVRLRARYQLSADEFRGLYISDEQVDLLLRKQDRPVDVKAITAKAESIRRRHESNSELSPEWRRIAGEFSLTPVEEDLLFVALAPELDSKYRSLYAYLNNDVSCKFATRDLARRLLSERGPTAVDHALASGSALFRNGLLVPAAASRGFQPSPVLSGFVLATEAQPIPPLLRVAPKENIRAAEHGTDLDRKPHAAAMLRERAVLVLSGSRGAGQIQLATELCRCAGMSLLVLDAKDVPPERESSSSLARNVALQARLEGAALFIENSALLFDPEGAFRSESGCFLRSLDEVPLCLACPPNLNWAALLGDRRTIEWKLPVLSGGARIAEWQRATATMAITAPPGVIDDLAQQFVFTTGEIAFAVRRANDVLAMEKVPIRDALFAAARAQSARDLGKLASKVTTSHRWADLVLPRATANQVRDVAAAIRDRGFVYEEWQLCAGSRPAGLNVLFSGASGTGKTMSASVIAAESGLDLYRIDLAAIVSKYIGETEKNLERIFTAARSSNAILFFDEADALFGKRSEVKDAHDRYANVEAAYLLQKLEEHDGVVILATNLPRNVDQAFMRRIQFHVEFPLPAEPDRESLWRGVFPAAVPLSNDVDFRFLARQFPLTGGQIRSVGLDAAFLAAADGRRITMSLLIKAVARQFVRDGRIPTVNDFRDYFSIATEMTLPTAAKAKCGSAVGPCQPV
jgi:ATPase family associated with various cellular activities (AAA)